jgi:hypothetical protein
MISVVGDYSKFDLQTTIMSSAKLRTTSFDRPPVGYGANIAELEEPEPDKPSLLQTSINALLQTLQSSKQDSGSKPGNCHLCNKPGHWARECPNKNQIRQSSGGQYKPPWKTSDPSKTEECTKVEGEGNNVKWTVVRTDKIFYWCGKCNRWSTTHWTKEHTGRVTESHIANLTVLSAVDSDSEDWPCAFVANVSNWDEPSKLMGRLRPFTLHLVIIEAIAISTAIQYLGM